MVNNFRECDGALEWSARNQTLRLGPWGSGAIRVRATLGPILDGLPGALLDPPDAASAVVKIEDGTASRRSLAERPSGAGAIRLARAARP
jgi:alpha-D-xyloside xylohydrolase